MLQVVQPVQLTYYRHCEINKSSAMMDANFFWLLKYHLQFKVFILLAMLVTNIIIVLIGDDKYHLDTEKSFKVIYEPIITYLQLQKKH